MIESSNGLIPEEAVSYLNSIEGSQKQKQGVLNKKNFRDELLSWCVAWQNKVSNWRAASYESDWHKWQRAADSIYEPELKRKKKDWQSCVFVPMTASHREDIQARLFKLILGPRPILDIKSRNSSPEFSDQSLNIRDLILREIEKSKLEVGMNSILEQGTTYGSAFARIRWDEVIEERVIREPKKEAISVSDFGSIGRALTGKRRQVGYDETKKLIPVYRGVRFESLDIWDIFWEPRAINIKGNAIAMRFWISFDDILKGVEKGYYFQEAIDILRNVSKESKPSGQDQRDADRGISTPTTERPVYGNQHEAFELYARLPQKWVLENIEGDPEQLVPAKVQFTETALLSVEPNENYDGEAPFRKWDYMPVAGRFIGRGIPEMTWGSQGVINEVVNQRLDNGALILNKSYGVIEKALVNPKDLNSQPGMIIRVDAKYAQDVRQAVVEYQTSDIPVRAGFSEVNEAERWAQERTSANRVTMGTAGQTRDTNQTLGGMNLLNQSAGEKFSYLGMTMEFSFLREVFKDYWKLIYKHINLQEVTNVLGPSRAESFMLLTPEMVENDYIYEPMGVFTMENKALRQVRIESMVKLFGVEPWFNRMAAFDKIAQSNDENPDFFKLKPNEMGAPPGMPGPQGIPGNPGQMEGPPPGMPPGMTPPPEGM